MGFDQEHLLLMAGDSAELCRRRLANFFEKNFLVSYDTITVLEDQILSADASRFDSRLEQGIAENRARTDKLLSELEGCGYRCLSDLGRLPQGYESKLLHLICHLLDGFFGIDTFFYNLEEDSHDVSPSLRQQIREKPGQFWLMGVRCGLESAVDRLDQVRRFEVRP